MVGGREGWKRAGRTHHVHWRQSLSRAVGIHGLGDIPADVHLLSLSFRYPSMPVCVGNSVCPAGTCDKLSLCCENCNFLLVGCDIKSTAQLYHGI